MALAFILIPELLVRPLTSDPEVVARHTVAQLRARGVAVRPFPALPHIGDALRFSVGPWPLLERCLAAFDAAVAEVLPDRAAVVNAGASA